MITKASERHYTGDRLVFGKVQGFGPFFRGFPALVVISFCAGASLGKEAGGAS
nr:MAG TPA: hypothetical protein [Caudoviricetes sp.]